MTSSGGWTPEDREEFDALHNEPYVSPDGKTWIDEDGRIWTKRDEMWAREQQKIQEQTARAEAIIGGIAVIVGLYVLTSLFGR